MIGRKRLALAVAMSFLTVAGVVAVLLARSWPFTRAAVTKALQDRFARQVQIRAFRKTYFPPGCIAEGVSFLHRKRRYLPPLITVQTLVVKASWPGLLRFHKHLSEVQVLGLHVLVPPTRVKGQPSPVMPLTNTTSGAYVTIGKIATDDALLEFLPRVRDRESFTLRVRHLTLTHIGEDGDIGYHAVVANTLPPGKSFPMAPLAPGMKMSPAARP